MHEHLPELKRFPVTLLSKALVRIELQAKLLQAIEEKRVRRLGAVADQRVDVKLIAASQVALSACVAAGRFRADLYHRLVVVILEMPPLRARGDDVLVLAQHFLRRYTAAHRLPPKQLSRTAEAWLLAQAWPDNVRALRHLMERVTRPSWLPPRTCSRSTRRRMSALCRW